jgi:transposase
VARFIGIDSHKDTVTAWVVDDIGRKTQSITAVNDGRGFRKIERLIEREQPVRVGIEGSGGYGLALAQRLLASGVDVREVPPHLTRRERRSHAKGKSDTIDALLIARVVAREPNLPPPPRAALAHDLKALVGHRDTLVQEAIRHRNRAHALLLQMCPGYHRVVPKLDSATRIAKALKLISDDASVRANLVRDSLARVQELTHSAGALEKEIQTLVRATGTGLTNHVGIGDVVAARILGAVGDVTRLSGQAAFGALSGTAPVPASSGRTDRWRLNRGGNRQLNLAIHTMALTQRRCERRARDYLASKRAAGKSETEAVRCLKRHLARVIYRQLVADHAANS